MKVLGIITSRTEASARARVLQYAEPLRARSVELTPKIFKPLRYNDPEPWAYTVRKIIGVNPWRSLQVHKTITRLPLLYQQFNYDLIWLNRLVIPQQAFYEKKIKKPLVFDFDDAIWLRDGKNQVAEAIAASQMVFAGNEYLAEFAAKHNKECQVIPTTINTERLFPLGYSHSDFVIGWIGTITNFKYLDIAKEAIMDFLAATPGSRFIVISSEPPPQITFDNQRIIFRKWEEDKENEYINEFSIGIMPLVEDDFTLGKCSYKMLQYLACGKPVVVSPVGMNNKVLNQGTVGIAATTTAEWRSAFTEFYHDRSLYTTCSGNGAKLITDHYSVKKFTPVIAAHFEQILHSSKNSRA